MFSILDFLKATFRDTSGNVHMAMVERSLSGRIHLEESNDWTQVVTPKLLSFSVPSLPCGPGHYIAGHPHCNSTTAATALPLKHPRTAPEAPTTLHCHFTSVPLGQSLRFAG